MNFYIGRSEIQYGTLGFSSIFEEISFKDSNIILASLYFGGILFPRKCERNRLCRFKFNCTKLVEIRLCKETLKEKLCQFNQENLSVRCKCSSTIKVRGEFFSLNKLILSITQLLFHFFL